jgi:hypothetical protein
MTTSFNSDNLATDINGYFVSTVNQQKLQPSFPYIYCSILKKLGPSTPLLVIGTDSATTALSNHIGIVRMISSSDSSEWAEENVWKYLPGNLVQELDLQLEQGKISDKPNNFDSEYCRFLIGMSGLELSDRSGHNKAIIWLLLIIILGILIWAFS